MSDIVKITLDIAKGIQADLLTVSLPPVEGAIPKTEQVIPNSLVRNTRGYIEKVVHQINGTYENGYYDACAVMMRRLVETLIIEAFEHHKIVEKIKDSQGNFLQLRDLVQAALVESSWNLGRKAKASLPKLKDLGDRSAHDRRYNAHRQDIDNLIIDFRAIVQEFVALAGLK